MMITNTRLGELRSVAHHCRRRVDNGEASVLERDFVELYELFHQTVYPVKSDSPSPNGPTQKGPYLSILFSR